MHPLPVGLKFAVLNTALAAVPAMAMVQVSETASQAQVEGRALYQVAAVMGIISSGIAIAWYVFLAARLYLAWRRERRAKREGSG